MTSRTAWAPGLLNAGLTLTNFFNPADLTGLLNGNSILSSVTPIANQSALDMLFDVNFQLVIASSTIAVGATLVLWLFPQNQDGVTYGDNSLTTTAGGAAVTPGLYPKLTMPLRPAAAQTALYGWNSDPLTMPPGIWLPALQNNSGFTLAAGSVGKFRSYNINLNS